VSTPESVKLYAGLTNAIRAYWDRLTRQAAAQGAGGVKDTGHRSAVTGGKQLDDVLALLREAVIAAGAPESDVYQVSKRALPGWFRPTKEWDLLIVNGKNLVAAIEAKSQAGSFGNNYNNRIEEIVGLGFDARVAYREGIYLNSPKPWVGFVMLLEDCGDSTRESKGFPEPHFPVDPAFKSASYAKRYEISYLRMVKEQLYNAICLLLSNRRGDGVTREPCEELRFDRLVASLVTHVGTYYKLLAK
jgi:hypothetical protein